MNTWIISDTHFGHQKMIDTFKNPDGSFVRGQFANVDEMNEHIVAGINAVVKPGDKGYHLGDVAMPPKGLSFIKRLHGRWNVILGNHDLSDHSAYINAGFKKVQSMRVLDKVLLSHIPIHDYSMARWLGNVHGHIHDGSSPPGRYLNVTVEALNYTPITFEDAVSRLRAIPTSRPENDKCPRCEHTGLLEVLNLGRTIYECPAHCGWSSVL